MSILAAISRPKGKPGAITVTALISAAACIAFSGCRHIPADQELLTAAGKPAESSLEPFLGEPLFEKQMLYSADDGGRTRSPHMVVSVDGDVLAMGAGRLRRSEDGGSTWSDPQRLPVPHIVDENSGDVLSLILRDRDAGIGVNRSRDGGRTWEKEDAPLQLNEFMQQVEASGARTRSSSEGRSRDLPKYYLHVGANESGITLRHGEHRGRLLHAATFRPHTSVHPSDREGDAVIYATAIYSDDGGASWRVSELFPEGYTEETAMVELSDGRIYYNARSHQGYHDSGLARELTIEDVMRREAWSRDGGHSWEDLRISSVLPDGGGYFRGYGLRGGLVRLPVKGRDILVFSNTDTRGGEREKMSVWASFDGGDTWPVKRLVYSGPSAYSTLNAGRPETAGAGQVYLLFEGAETHRYHGIQFARFNIAWLLEGEKTGDGEVPAWVKR